MILSLEHDDSVAPPAYPRDDIVARLAVIHDGFVSNL
jgi:hypothetical protein